MVFLRLVIRLLNVRQKVSLGTIKIVMRYCEPAVVAMWWCLGCSIVVLVVVPIDDYRRAVRPGFRPGCCVDVALVW